MTTVSQDGEHLRLLSIFHYVVGGLMALAACFPLIHVGVGILFMLKPGAFADEQPPPPVAMEMFGLLFVLIGGAFVLVGWSMAGLVVAAGRFLHQRKRHTFCVVIGVLSCLLFPLGTILGVCSLIVLLRPSVKEMFA